MTDTAPQPGPSLATVRRAPLWMWVVLVLSVALNIVVLGAAARAVWHFRGGHFAGEHGPGGFTPYLRSLPATRRDEIARLLDGEREAMQALRRDAREKRRELADAFAAEPLDTARLAAAARAASEARIALIRQRESFFPSLAAKLSAEERRAYLDWRSDRRWRRWHEHHRRGEDDTSR